MIGAYLVLPVILGHFCLTVLAVNMVHGLGLSEKRLKAIKIVSIAWLAGMGGLLVQTCLASNVAGWRILVMAYGLVCATTALVGLPIETVRRWLRPKVVSGTSMQSVTRNLVGNGPIDRFIGRGWDTFWLRLPGNQAFELDFVNCEVELGNLPETLDGLSILQLSDLHLAPAYSRRFFQEVFDHVEMIEADLVLFTGDLIDDEAMLEWVPGLLSRTRGRLGQYSILGNHDFRFETSRCQKTLEEAGFTPIDGRWTQIHDEAGTIALGGTSSPWGSWLSPEQPPKADVRILLCHTPDEIYRASKLGIDFMLSGHTHGGQYRIPGIGPVLMPSRYSRRFDLGFFRVESTLLYVTRGIAAQHPLRVNCRPEITRFVLRSPRRLTHRPGLLNEARHPASSVAGTR